MDGTGLMSAYLGYRDGDADTPWGKYFNPCLLYTSDAADE